MPFIQSFKNQSIVGAEFRQSNGPAGIADLPIGFFVYQKRADPELCGPGDPHFQILLPILKKK